MDNSDKNINKAFIKLIESKFIFKLFYYFYFILCIYREQILNKIIAVNNDSNMKLDKSENISTAEKKKKGCC